MILKSSSQRLPGARGSRRWRVTGYEYRVSIWGDEKAIELDCGAGFIVL